MKYIEKQILKELNKKLKLRDKVILFILKRYTFIIYKKGFIDGFNSSNVDNVNDLSTLKKL